MDEAKVLTRPLFEGPRIVLAAPDPEQDAEVEAGWTHDADYLRSLSLDPARPLTVEQVKQRHGAADQKENTVFPFVIRARDDDRLLGFVRLFWIAWSNGVAMLTLGIGSAADRRQGYGREALDLILRYAFAELNLYRLAVVVAEDNEAAVRFLEQAGFTLEVRQRQAMRRNGRNWDVLMYGLLAADWAVRNPALMAGGSQFEE